MTKINVKGKQFSYAIKRKPINSINLRFTSKKSFYVSCPSLTPSFIITKFLRRHTDWIYKNSQKLIHYPKLKNLTDLCILNQKYLVRIILTDKNDIFFNHQHKTIKIFTDNLAQASLQSIIQKYFKSLAKKLIQNEVNNIGDFPDIKRISVRNQKTRFGSCSGKGHLSFNWQIIFFPRQKFRHVICHELTHLKIKNHQKKFYLALSKLDTNWQANNKWLKTDAKKYFIIKP